MSSFIVNNETYLNVYNDLRKRKLSCIENCSDHKLQDLIYALRNSNIEAFNYRYENRYPKYIPEDFVLFNSDIILSEYQLLKSIRCIMYQCCEGNVPKKIGSIWKEIQFEIMYGIIDKLKEYNEADWS